MKDSLDMERRDRITDRKIINTNPSTEIIYNRKSGIERGEQNSSRRRKKSRQNRLRLKLQSRLL